MGNICLMMTVESFLSRKKYPYTINTDYGELNGLLPENRIYSIPSYQREIRWSEENVRILLNDLEIGSKFLGTILLNKVSDHEYEIIDGQQRISVFLLIINAITKINSDQFTSCTFENKTYECIFDAMHLDFDIEKINANERKDELLNSDILEQRERFEIIWKTINDYIKDMIPTKVAQLFENLLYSDVNIIVAENANPRIFVDYYLDLNDKSVKLDHIDILKANLFKFDYKLMADEWANVQKTIKLFRITGLNYSPATFYFHYFACTVNEYLGYKLSGIKMDMKFSKDTVINEHRYESGTNILRAIGDKQFFKKAIADLKAVSEFLKNIYQKNGLIELKTKMKGAGCDDDTINCVIEIINAILRIDDEVPKILVMKYFLEVLNRKKINKAEVKAIYYIYVYSIFFAVASDKKESSKLVRIVLSENWQKVLRERTLEFYTKSKSKVKYMKTVTQNGKTSDISGQYMHKHIIAIKEFCSETKESLSFNEHKLKEYLLSPSCSAEHFFINRSHKVTYTYGDKNSTAEIQLPKKLLKYISAPVNYIYLKSNANRALGNSSIKEKIEKLSTMDKSVFASEENYHLFSEIVEAFNDAEDFPDMSKYNNKTKSQQALRKYYNTTIFDVMDAYVKKIQNP